MRLDVYLVSKKYVDSRNKAKELIKDKKVFVNSVCQSKPNYQINIQDNIKINDFYEYVSRAAFKLKYAIEQFNIDLNNKIVLDIGSSTGGFTQICLLNKAKHVFCVDVGTDQMNKKISVNKKITLYENTNFKFISKEKIFKKIDFICCDVSFISLTKIIDKLVDLFNYKYEGVFLIKPQFELSRKELCKTNGIVKSKVLRKKVLENISIYFKKNEFTLIKIIESPILGKTGNIEYLAYVKK